MSGYCTLGSVRCACKRDESNGCDKSGIITGLRRIGARGSSITNDNKGISRCKSNSDLAVCYGCVETLPTVSGLLKNVEGITALCALVLKGYAKRKIASGVIKIIRCVNSERSLVILTEY